MRKLHTVSARPLLLLVALATRHYGRTLKELMEELGCPRRCIYRHLAFLERYGVEIRRQREPIRGGWVTLYKLSAIRGLRFDIRQKA